MCGRAGHATDQGAAARAAEEDAQHSLSTHLLLILQALSTDGSTVWLHAVEVRSLSALRILDMDSSCHPDHFTPKQADVFCTMLLMMDGCSEILLFDMLGHSAVTDAVDAALLQCAVQAGPMMTSHLLYCCICHVSWLGWGVLIPEPCQSFSAEMLTMQAMISGEGCSSRQL